MISILDRSRQRHVSEDNNQRPTTHEKLQLRCMWSGNILMSNRPLQLILTYPLILKTYYTNEAEKIIKQSLVSNSFNSFQIQP